MLLDVEIAEVAPIIGNAYLISIHLLRSTLTSKTKIRVDQTDRQDTRPLVYVYRYGNDRHNYHLINGCVSAAHHPL